jgi:hypothetical protein
MMRRAVVLAGIAVAVTGLVASAHAEGRKRLPKAVSLVESKSEPHLSYFVRGAKATPTPAPSGAVREVRPYSPSHGVREMPAPR